LLLYQVKNGEKSFTRIQTPAPLEIVLGNSGITADTSALGPFVIQQKEKDPKLFSTRLTRIKAQVSEMQQALEAGDLEKVGAIMTENHKILIDMGLSHEKLIYLCRLALEQGALGAKLTGGGRGGYMIALTPGKALQEVVASTMEREGYKVIRATIGGS
jgi:mevalonate kinase